MLLSNQEANCILSLMLIDKKQSEEMLSLASEEVKVLLNSNIQMLNRLILEFKLGTSINFQAEAVAISTRYILIKNYNNVEMFWTGDCMGYTQDISQAGTFSEEEANHHLKGHILRLIDLINCKHKNIENYAVTLGDYISYLQALIK